MLGALHVHSSYSRDGRDSLPDLHAFAAARGIRFLGLTDHAEDLDRELFRQYVHECVELSDDRVTLIPGLEFRFAGHKGMHLLALGLRDWMDPRTPEEFFQLSEGVTGLTIAAHPVFPRYRYPQVVLDRVHAIEVWNATYNTRFLPDPRAIRLLRQVRARRPEVVAVVGLDQHDSRNDRETRVVVDASADPLAAMREGRFQNIGRTMRFDSAAELGPVRDALLWVGRAIFDRVERTQERGSKWLSRRRRGSAKR